MKFEDVKIGQILKDVYGNRYEVIDISNKVLVKCIEFKKSVRVDSYTALVGVNQTLWVLKDRSMMLPIHEGFGKFIKDNFYSNLALSGNLEPITVDICGIKKHYLLAQQSTIDKITLTLSEMEIVEDDYLTRDNVKIGMTVIDGLGNEYVVIGYGARFVQMTHNMKFTNMDGMVKNIDVAMYIPYYNGCDAENVCTTKDFQIVKSESK